jgi:hypothetical protein
MLPASLDYLSRGPVDFVSAVTDWAQKELEDFAGGSWKIYADEPAGRQKYAQCNHPQDQRNDKRSTAGS